MQVNPDTGLLDCALQYPSANCDARPAGCSADLIVIHGISLPPGQYGGDWIHALFQNRLDATAHPYFAQIADLRVSSHLQIDRSGTVYQYVAFHQRAWHAGKSNYRGRPRCNDFAIGIELEGCDDSAYTDTQYDQLVGVITALCAAYPKLSLEALAGHSDIAPGRKTDPGEAFDWPRVHRELAAPTNPQANST